MRRDEEEEGGSEEGMEEGLLCFTPLRKAGIAFFWLFVRVGVGGGRGGQVVVMVPVGGSGAVRGNQFCSHHHVLTRRDIKCRY